MKRKLELHEIAGYLPYGLGIKCNITKAHTLFGYYKTFYQQWEEWAVVNDPDEENQTSNVLFDDIAPILRPLSDLYKPITHNGEEIVPIVELAKRAFNFNVNDWNMVIDANSNFYRSVYFVREKTIQKEIIYFWYDKAGYFAINNSVFHTSQYGLFDYLHELKVDFRGLIDAGLAIDCNTLENNPYK